VFLKKWLNWGFVVFIMVISWLWCINSANSPKESNYTLRNNNLK
jgi:hypothetical protein